MMVLLAVLGAVSLLGQVVLLRELTVAFYGAELVILLGVGLWLTGTGLGAAGGWLGERGRPAALAAGLPSLALLLPLLVVLARGVRVVCGGVPGAYLAFPIQLAAMAVVMLPGALLSGFMFAHAARLAAERGRTLAAAYASECAGGLVGGAAATVLLAAGVGNLAQALGGGLVAALAAAAGARTGRRTAAGAAAGCALLLVVGLAFSPSLDRRTTAWNHPDLLTMRDTPYGRVTAEWRSGQLILFQDGALAWENEGTAAEAFVQLASLQVDAPRRVLVLGGGAAGLVNEARRLDAAELIYVEPDHSLLELLESLPADLGLGPAGPGRRPQVVVADPRRYLKQADGFDLILVGEPEPASGRDNRFYTQEFFAACAGALAPGGVVALRLQGAENLWTPARVRQLASIQRALQDVFPAVVVMPGAVTVLMASPAPLPRTAARPAARLRTRGTDNRLVTPAYLEYLYANDRFGALAAKLAAADAPANTDRHPGCYRQTLLLWAARFFPSLGWRDLEPPALGSLVRSRSVWLAAVAGLIAVLAARSRPPWRRPLAMAAAGATGMMLEAALILDYQVRVGALHQDLGLLLCLFMLGMAAGAAAGARMAAAGPRRRELATLPVAALGVALLLRGGILDSLVAAGAALAFSAAAVGLVFAALSRTEPGSQEQLVAPLLAADLVGSGLGCLAATLVLIPVWGQGGAAAAAVLLGLLVLLG